MLVFVQVMEFYLSKCGSRQIHYMKTNKNIQHFELINYKEINIKFKYYSAVLAHNAAPTPLPSLAIFKWTFFFSPSKGLIISNASKMEAWNPG